MTERVVGVYEQLLETHADIAELLFLETPLRWLIESKSLEYCIPWEKYNTWVWLVPQRIFPAYAANNYLAFIPDELLMLFGSTRGFNVMEELDQCYKTKCQNTWMILTSLVPLEFTDYRSLQC